MKVVLLRQPQLQKDSKPPSMPTNCKEHRHSPNVVHQKCLILNLDYFRTPKGKLLLPRARAERRQQGSTMSTKKANLGNLPSFFFFHNGLLRQPCLVRTDLSEPMKRPFQKLYCDSHRESTSNTELSPLATNWILPLNCLSEVKPRTNE
jgi:hypothetical protein